MAHNPELAKQQKISTNINKIIDHLHEVRILLKEEAIAHNDSSYLIELYTLWEQNELTLQKLWKFPPNTGYMRFWDFPKCTCPKLDNDDNYPTGPYVVNKNCIIHGKE